MKTNTTTKFQTQTIVLVGMFTAILAVLSQLSIPMPSGVPITCQTFAIALTGYLLGWKFGTISTLIYLLIGILGVPVFSNLKGGIGVLFAKTGGFLIGFIFMTFLCGLAIHFQQKNHKLLLIIFSLFGLAICHTIGVFQFSMLTGSNMITSATLVSFPYLVKDIISMILAYFISISIKKAIPNLMIP